jgi:hypothetical protein
MHLKENSLSAKIYNRSVKCGKIELEEKFY